MKTNPLFLPAKIGILIIMMIIGTVGCKPRTTISRNSIIRFEKLALTIPPEIFSDSIHLNHSNLIPFFRIFNEEVIRIGPDSLPGYAGQWERFTSDTLIRQLYSLIDKSAGIYLKSCREIDDALGRCSELTGMRRPECLITFISGFNQSFITLPGAMGIGVDNYLGSESRYYQELGLPAYVRKNRNPENLTSDAVRAWIYSELPGITEEEGFLGRMIFEGKVYYIAGKLLKNLSDEQLFHFSDEQLHWCLDQEKSMWKYLAEQKILFSTDRLNIRKFIEEAPFTRDFGNDSPGRAGVWIGYRIVSSYMKATGTSLRDLIGKTSATEILSASGYHP